MAYYTYGGFDHLGGLLATMSGSVGGAVHTIILRDAWGKQVHKAGTAAIGTAYLYTGQRWDELLGLYDYNARWYDPGTGRFVSADTIVPDEGNPQAYSRYSYVLNRPLQLVDPSGHVPKLEDGSNPDDYHPDEECSDPFGSFRVSKFLSIVAADDPDQLYPVVEVADELENEAISETFASVFNVFGAIWTMLAGVLAGYGVFAQLAAGLAGAVTGFLASSSIGQADGPLAEGVGAFIGWLVAGISADALETLLEAGPGLMITLAEDWYAGNTYYDQRTDEWVLGQETSLAVHEIFFDIAAPASPIIDLISNTISAVYEVFDQIGWISTFMELRIPTGRSRGEPAAYWVIYKH